MWGRMISCAPPRPQTGLLAGAAQLSFQVSKREAGFQAGESPRRARHNVSAARITSTAKSGHTVSKPTTAEKLLVSSTKRKEALGSQPGPSSANSVALDAIVVRVQIFVK